MKRRRKDRAERLKTSLDFDYLKWMDAVIPREEVLMERIVGDEHELCSACGNKMRFSVGAAIRNDNLSLSSPWISEVARLDCDCCEETKRRGEANERCGL